MSAFAFTPKEFDYLDFDSWFKKPWLPYYPPFVDVAFIPADKPALWMDPFYAAPTCQYK